MRGMREWRRLSRPVFDSGVPRPSHRLFRQHAVRSARPVAYADTTSNLRASGSDATAEIASTSGRESPRAAAHDRRLMLIDSHALLYRYHYAFGPKLLSDGRGRDTTIAYGFLQTVLTLLELSPPPTHMAAVFDAKGKTFRHEIFPEYKAQRPRMPDAIKEAIPCIQEILAAMAIPVMSVPGVEADDVIGSVALRGLSEGCQIAIASPDKDFYQLLQPNLQLLRPPRKGEGGKILGGGVVPYSEASFEAEFGIRASQWADVLAICGDSVDNVPGVPGIGIKGALELIRKFDSLEQLLSKAPEVTKKRQREILSSAEGVAAARLGLELVTIQTALQIPPVRMPFEELELRPLSPQRQEQVLELLGEMDFRQHMQRLTRLWRSKAVAQAA